MTRFFFRRQIVLKLKAVNFQSHPDHFVRAAAKDFLGHSGH